MKFEYVWLIVTFALVIETHAVERNLRVSVDATDAARHLLVSTIEIPVKPGPMALWYPKWIPGIHGPGEQIRNIGGLTVKTDDGKRLDWRRDDDDLYKFHIDVPGNADEITVELTYICNQPTRVSTGVDSFGNAHTTVINFNTCLMYPDGWSSQETTVDLRLKIPNWKFGTSLKTNSTAGGWIEFERDTFENIVDSPMIAGENYRLLEIETPNFPKTRMHFVSDRPQSLNFDEALESQFRRMMAEGASLFGGAPFETYDFLVYCSDELPGTGLEHLSSSLNGIDEGGLTKEDVIKSGLAYLLPHELVHAWCGKYRRPVGMFRNDFHTTKQTRLLWIYEGLTQYLGQVITARSGLISYDEHIERLAGRIGYLANRTGRNWRALEDTAISGHTLRGGSQSWNDLRRNQDYYDEGAIFWMEVDAILRKQTRGEKSLDDFCHRFFAVPENSRQPIKPFALEEIVSILNQIVAFDWQGLIDRRIMKPQASLSLEPLDRVGYEFTYVDDAPESVKLREKERKYISAEYSLGLTVDKEKNQVRSVKPDSPADKAGLTAGMEFVAVNGRRFTEDRFREALKATKENRSIEFVVYQSDNVRTITVPYLDGPRFPMIKAVEGKQNILQQICSPKASD